MLFPQNNYYIILFRNLSGLFTSLFTTYTIYDYTFNNNNSLIENNGLLIVANILVDSLMTNSPSVLLHHAITLGYSVIFYSYSLEIQELTKTAIILISTEISTIFLCIREIFRAHPVMKTKMKLINKVNDIFFMSSFFYFRIYLIPSYVFFDPDFFYSTHNTYISERSFYILSYALTGLNIYWGGIIFHSAIRNFLK